MATIKKAQFGKIIGKAIKSGVKKATAAPKKTITDSEISTAIKMSERDRLKKMFQKIDAEEAARPKQRMGGKTVKKMMKTGGTLSPTKKSVGKTIGKLNKAKYGSKMQAGGVAGKQPKAGMVDPKGAYTKVQMRTLGNMKKGGKMSMMKKMSKMSKKK